MAKILLTINAQTVCSRGLYATRAYTGCVIVTVKFYKDHSYKICHIDYESDGAFYEHDYITDFVYDNITAEPKDIEKLTDIVSKRLPDVIYGKRKVA